MSSEIEPCQTCGSEGVFLVEGRLARRMSETEGEKIEVRRCPNPTCPTNTSARRLGDVV